LVSGRCSFDLASGLLETPELDPHAWVGWVAPGCDAKLLANSIPRAGVLRYDVVRQNGGLASGYFRPDGEQAGCDPSVGSIEV